MKIQLVSAPLLSSNKFGEFWTNNWPPLGVMYLASYLKKNFSGNLRIKITDGALLGQKRTTQEVLSFAPDVLAISALTPSSTGGYSLVNQVKEKMPSIFVVFGGVHASSLPEEVLRTSKTDLVVFGEGEKTFLEIVKRLDRKEKNFHQIPGVVFLKKGKITKNPPRQFISNLDLIPFPDYKLIDNLDKYVGWYFQKQSPETVIMSTRGCPHQCFFCNQAIWKSAKPYLRVRSPKNIADELEMLAKDYGIREYIDLADEFNCLEPWAIDVCQEIKKRRLGLTWRCQLRVDKVSDRLARNLAETGCWYVQIGAESGNQRTLDGIGKDITLEQTQKACQTLKKYGITVNALFMLFNVWEENGKLAFEGVKESLNTLRFAQELFRQKLIDFFAWCPTTPYPGAPLYSFSLKHKLIPNEILGHWEKWNNLRGIYLNLPRVSQSDYNKVKAYGALIQSSYFFKKISWKINLSTLTQLIKRGLGALAFIFWLLIEKLRKLMIKK